MYPGAPAQSSRPTVVTVSSYLLYLSAALTVLSAVLSLTTISTISDVYTDLYAGTADSGLESVIVGVSIIGIVVNILFAAGLAILAIFNNRGRQGARITTWVVGGIFLCCNGFGLIGGAATSGMNFDTGTTGAPSAREVEERLSAELPSWLTPVTTTLGVLLVLALLGALILLMLPAANAYFRKPQATWDPSMPYPGGQPGYPGYPPAGYPQQGAYPAPGSFPPYPGTAAPGSAPGPTPGSAPGSTPGSAPDSTPSGSTPPGSTAPGSTPPAGEAPHTGSVPATDPWSAPSPPSSAPPTPPSSPSSDQPDQPGRPPTDPA